MGVADASAAESRSSDPSSPRSPLLSMKAASGAGPSSSSPRSAARAGKMLGIQHRRAGAGSGSRRVDDGPTGGTAHRPSELVRRWEAARPKGRAYADDGTSPT